MRTGSSPDARRCVDWGCSAVTFPGVDHAFFNPTSSRHDPAAAAAAYRRMLSWFGKHVAT